MRSAIGLALVICILSMPCPAWASTRPPIYVLAIGSSRYLPPEVPADHGFEQLPGAGNGATAFAERLVARGARHAIVLTSSDGTVVGLADIERALTDILSKIVRERGASKVAPVLFVYIASHGISDGFAWNHFSVPGDLTYRGEPERLGIDALAEQSVHAASLVDRLNKSGVHYMLILDSCYEGKASRFDSPVLSTTAQQNIGDISTALQQLNEFRQGDPVIFSATPGTSVPTAPDPDDPESNSMGPMARRLILLFKAADDQRRIVSVADVFAALTAPAADKLTRAGVSHAERVDWWDTTIIRPKASSGTLEQRGGTAIVARLCCDALVAPPSARAMAVVGSIRFAGEPGEPLSGGRTWTVSKGITLERLSDSKFSITVSDQDGDWSLEFSSSAGLKQGTFARAMRAGFEDAGRPGLAVTGRHTGCNEVAGEFEILAWPTDRGGHIVLRFRHVCDDIQPALLGDIDIVVPPH